MLGLPAVVQLSPARPSLRIMGCCFISQLVVAWFFSSIAAAAISLLHIIECVTAGARSVARHLGAGALRSSDLGVAMLVIIIKYASSYVHMSHYCDATAAAANLLLRLTPPPRRHPVVVVDHSFPLVHIWGPCATTCVIRRAASSATRLGLGTGSLSVADRLPAPARDDAVCVSLVQHHD